MADFSVMNEAEIAAFANSRQEEMGSSGLTEADILAALQTGRAVLEIRPHGFAVVELKEADQKGKFIPHLWLLYIDSEQQGRGLGQRFVRELKAIVGWFCPVSISEMKLR